MERAVGVAILCLSVLEIWNLIESIRRDRFEERVTVVADSVDRFFHFVFLTEPPGPVIRICTNRLRPTSFFYYFSAQRPCTAGPVAPQEKKKLAVQG